MNKTKTFRRLLPIFAASLLAFSCYTMRTNPPKRVPQSEVATKNLHRAIYDYVEEYLYVYPHIATRMGMHIRKLQSGEVIRLDRELPNFSEDVVSSRIDTLHSYRERMVNKVPPEALCANDQADLKLFMDAIDKELLQIDTLKTQNNNPLVHVNALAEAIYYPLVIDYAPEKARMADILGRMHWIPSFVDRAVRLLEGSSSINAEEAAKINRWTTSLIKEQVANKISKDKVLSKSFDGMKKPVLDSLAKLQDFLDKNLKSKPKRTWRMGDDNYNELFALEFHGLTTPSEATDAANSRVDTIRHKMFKLAKPAYCEANEQDRKICGPTRAEIKAAARAEAKKKKAEEKRIAAQEERERKAEEKAAKAEERKARAEEKRLAAEEERERKAEEKKAKAEEKKAAAEEKKKKKEDVTNPYENKPKKKKKEKKDTSGVSNPYSYCGAAPNVGAKLVGDDDEADDEEESAEDTEDEDRTDEGEQAVDEDVVAEEDENVSDRTISKVIAWALGSIDNMKLASNRTIRNLERQLKNSAHMAKSKNILSSTGVDSLTVDGMPAFLSSAGLVVAFDPQAVFQPEQGARIYVLDKGPQAQLADLTGPRLFFASSRNGSPGKYEVYRRAVEIEKQTRRAVRVLYGDAAFVEGWALYASSLLNSKIEDDDDPWKAKFVAYAEELAATVGLLVDVGLHADGLDESKALDMLTDRAHLSSQAAKNTVHQAKMRPTSLAAQYVGARGWKQAVKAIKKTKKKFKRKKFHDAALSFGPVPLVLLPQLFDGDPDEPPDSDEVLEEVETEKTVTIIDAIAQ